MSHQSRDNIFSNNENLLLLIGLISKGSDYLFLISFCLNLYMFHTNYSSINKLLLNYLFYASKDVESLTSVT